MKTIKDAYEELKGDLKNTYLFNCSEHNDIYLLINTDKGHYITNSSKSGSHGSWQYICTVEEFNNYKGDDVKSVLDAVIEFKGEWPYVNHYVCVPAEENDVAEKGEFHSAKSKYTNEMWVNVCNESEFNTLVDHLASNMGRCDIGFSEHCSNEAIRIINTETKPVYTQAMCDAGECPTTGMKALHDCSKYHYPDSGDWNEVTILGSLDGEIFFRNAGSSYIFAANEVSRFKPLTPPIELIDGKAYQFQAHKNRNPVDGFYSVDEDEFIYLQGTVRSHDAINIKLLEVKS